MIVASLSLQLASLQLAKGVLKIGERAFRIPNRCIVPPQNVWVCRSLTKKLGCLENLALRLYAFVDILDLLVELMCLEVDK